MDITQLHYFIQVVESDLNLSQAARKIHITQSALSKMISNFESEEELLLFERKNGRLEKLTSAGRQLYEYAVEIVAKYAEMREMIQRESLKQKGTIRIGMPSAVLRIYFLSFLPQFILDHPELRIEIVEAGAKELQEKLLQHDLDLAVLVDPANLNPHEFEEHVIQIDEYVAYTRNGHPLEKKGAAISWRSLKPYPIGTFQKNYTTYDLVAERLAKRVPGGKIRFTSDSLEYLLDLTDHSDTVIILQNSMYQYAEKKNIHRSFFKETLQFVLLLCRPKKPFYTPEEKFLYEAILEYFYQPVE